MIKTFKVMLCPNNKQGTKLFACAGAARFVYNWTLWYQQTNYELGYSFTGDAEIRRLLTALKKENPRFQWLNQYSNNIAKQAVKDACEAYHRFFKGLAKYPKFKKKRRSKPGFYADPVKIRFTETHVKLEKLTDSRKSNRQTLNWVKLAEPGRVSAGAKYVNPRVTFDGLNWWISVGVECEGTAEQPHNPGIGIDLGIKNLAVCSDGAVYGNINKTANVRKIKKQKCRLQRGVSRKYLKNKKRESYCKTRSIIKSEQKLLKINRRLTNIRHNHLHQVTSEIVSRKPRFVVLEDLNVGGMMKNSHLSQAVQEQGFYEFYRQMQYKCGWGNIRFITADRFFQSSRMCSCCGHVKKDLKLSERTYICPVCGNSIDRDFQASINLMRYGMTN